THFHVASLGAAWGESFVRVAQIGAHTFYRLTGRHEPAVHDAVYAHASAVADKPAYTEAKASPAAVPEGSSLMLAAAVAPAPGAAQRPSSSATPAPAEKATQPEAVAIATSAG